MRAIYYFMKALLFILFILPVCLNAQNSSRPPEFSSLPLWSKDMANNNRKVEGSPLLFKSFLTATIYLDQGKFISDIPANIDLENNELIVKNERKEIVAISVPAYRVVFEDFETGFEKTVLSGFPPIDKQTEKSFYELLQGGKITLLKSIRVTWMESRAYHEAVPTRVYEQTPVYYIYTANKSMIKLSGQLENISALIDKDQEVKLTKYITEHKLDLKTEQGLVELITFYNSL